MILVLLGTSPHPFSRLLVAAADYARKAGVVVMAQTGHTPVVVGVVCQPFFSHAELMRLVVEADVVLAQGGYGSLSDCVTAGAKTVAVPRRLEFMEAMHDQCELVDAFAKEGLVIPLYDMSGLATAIAQARRMAVPIKPQSALCEHIAVKIRALVEVK